MKQYNEEFHDQIAYLLKQYRDGNIKSIPDLMTFMEMAYGDYLDFHPDELPETRYDKPRTIKEKSGREQ